MARRTEAGRVPHPVISLIDRPHPTHQPVTGSSVQVLTHGDATSSDSGCFNPTMMEVRATITVG